MLEANWLQNVNYPARVDRQILTLIAAEGVMDGLVVGARGAGANMSVDISAGYGAVTGDDQADQGRYMVRSTAVENRVIAAAPATDARIDLVVARVKDANVTGLDNGFFLEVITGAVAASPVAPALPNTAIALAEVRVNAGQASVTATSITDVRTIVPIVAGAVSTVQANRLLRTDANSKFQVAAPTDASNPATKSYVDSADAADRAAAAALGTSGNTPETIVRRDSTGRASIAAPSSGPNIANKDYVDTHAATTGHVSQGGTFSGSANPSTYAEGITFQSAALAQISGTTATNDGFVVTMRASSGRAAQTFYETFLGGGTVWARTSATSDTWLAWRKLNN